MRRLIVLAVLLGVLILPVAAAQAASGGPHRSPNAALRQAALSVQKTLSPQNGWQVVASGLNNPRGLSFASDGSLYVAEAGVGGDGPCRIGPEEGEECYGPTGSITRIFNDQQTRVVTGLPSLASEGGFAATGPTDISTLVPNRAEVVIGWGGAPQDRAALGQVGASFGRTLHVSFGNLPSYRADVSGYEQTANPDGGMIDSNPYSILTRPIQAITSVVADAGGNDLLGVGLNGVIKTLAVFPDRMVPAPPFLDLPPGTMIPMQAVPNSVVAGPDGALYAGQLTGFPFPVGGANVYRVVPGFPPQVFAGGFTNIIDIAFGPDGSLYVLEITKNGLLSNDLTGALIRVAPNGQRTEIASDGLVAPAGLAVGPDGALYVSNFGIFPGAGQVVRIQAQP